MRRTHAPSQAGFKSACKLVKSNIAGKPFPDATRSTGELLNLLADSAFSETTILHIDLESEKSPECLKMTNCVTTSSNECSMTVESIFTNMKYYNVLWGKQSKKKHKTWEGDGVVEISNDVAILKDLEGVVLGRSSKFKMILEEGSRAFIGNKEIEVIEIIDKENLKDNTSFQKNKSKSESTSTTETASKICTFLNKRPFKRARMDPKFNIPISGETDKLLTMPRPDYDHQWKYNSEKLSIHDVRLDYFLSRILREHQREGVSFLYSCVTGIRNIKYNGAILTDEMGLGKTLQCISLIWLLLKHGPYGGLPIVQRVLIVTPSSLVTNWFKEFKKWLGFERLRPYIVGQKQKVSDFVNSVPSQKPVLIISYEMLIRQYDELRNCKFQLLICDEGHRLKNSQIRVAQLLSQLEIKRRIILTGTPIQNNLQEFFALIDFVNPGILGDYQEFKRNFEIPIVESNQPECCEEVKELGAQKATELHHITNSFILRRTHKVINKYLPSKQESVIFCSASQLQMDLYDAVVSYWENCVLDGTTRVPHLSVITFLKKICNDPRLVKLDNSNHFEADVENDEGEDFTSFGGDLLNKLQSLFPPNYESNPTTYSSKLFVIERLLEELIQTGEKIILVSYFTQTLDLLQNLCRSKDYSFLRLDGSTSVTARSDAVDKFNAPNSKFFVFLLSAKAGGVGLNLIGASRLILFDLDWNPASDLQAMSRIWRDGQKRNVYIYRLLIAGSIEEKIYQRQISKLLLSDVVIDISGNSNVRLSIDELKDLFTFQPDSPSLTHELMCECEGTGIPDISADESDSEERACQLGANIQTKNKSVIKKSELIQWEHYLKPVPSFVLDELLLQAAHNLVTFVFRNKIDLDDTSCSN